jgi:hypothetical protein
VSYQSVLSGLISAFVSALVALFINVFLPYLRKPRFRVSCGEDLPWQVFTTDESGGTSMLHVRLKVQNIGWIQEEACEVRIEQVFRVYATKIEPFLDHDPRPLKWVGRDTKPLALNTGAFDYVDLGVRRQDSLNHLRLDFANRGHLDLFINEEDLVGYRITGAIYGKQAQPRSFTFDLSWKTFDFSQINVKEL